MLGEDYRLELADNGLDAIEVAERFQPAFVFLDVMMPGMDGLETCRRLRQLPGMADAIIIMVSAKAMPSEQADGIDAGADHYITKPFDEAELATILRDYDGSSLYNTSEFTNSDESWRNSRLRSKF
jgi:CheY-like chemotaxis protein